MRWLSLLPAVCALALSAGCASEDPDLGVSHHELVETTPTSFVASGTIRADESHAYTVPLPEGAVVVAVDLDGDGDADLYTRGGETPSLDEFDCRPYLEGSEEACLQLTNAGELGVLVHGWAAVTHYELAIIFDGIGTSPGTER
jgi:hypothetical protein